MIVDAPKHLLGCVGDPTDVAYAIRFRVTDNASLIWDTHLIVDGSYTAQ